MEDRLGEVIAAGTMEFTAQCYELYRIPPLGSLVKTADGPMELYGIIYNATTASLEPGRKPIARGKDETEEAAVYQSSPQLLMLLRSEFSALVVGFKHQDKLNRYLPPQPARIHGFVYSCSPGEVAAFGTSFAFLSILLNARLPINPDELVAAALRQLSQEQADRRAYLITAGKELAGLLGNDYPRLKTILGRLTE
jgi:hypothetical protein